MEFALRHHEVADDFVVSTMETHSVREMVDYVFGRLGMDYKTYVTQNEMFLRPEELLYLKGDSTKIRTTIGWKPEHTFEMLMDDMIFGWFNKLGKNLPTLKDYSVK